MARILDCYFTISLLTKLRTRETINVAEHSISREKIEGAAHGVQTASSCLEL